METAHEEGLGVVALEFVVEGLGGLFHEAFHFLRVAGPGVAGGDVPADEAGGGGVCDFLRCFGLEEVVFGAEFPHSFRAEDFQDFRDEIGEDFGDAD